MPFQYTFRSEDIRSFSPETQDLLENRDRELELFLQRVDSVEISAAKGVIAYDTSTIDATVVSALISPTESVQITGSYFTASESRMYKITYFEPQINVTQQIITGRIRLSTISGQILNTSVIEPIGSLYPASLRTPVLVTWVGNLPPGLTNVVGTLSVGGSFGSAPRNGNQFAMLTVEDVGPSLFAVFILDSTAFGILDTNRLGYP